MRSDRGVISVDECVEGCTKRIKVNFVILLEVSEEGTDDFGKISW